MDKPIKISYDESLKDFVIKAPEYKASVEIVDSFKIMLVNEPSWFHKKMMKIFFGFKFEKVKK